MKQKLFSILALLLMAATGAWADESETINTATDGKTVYTGTHFKITASLGCDGDGIILWNESTSGTATIEALNGENITKIEMHMTYGGQVATYTTTTAGKLVATNSSGNANDISVTDINATSVTIGTSYNGVTWININKFVIYYGPAPAATTYSVTLAEGTEDGDKWTVKVGEGEAQVFPVEGLKGGETVTATYSGEKKVKSVKAVKKAPADPLAVPLTIEAITAGTIQVAQPKEGMQYSKNGGAKTAVTTSIDVAAGDKVQFYGNGTSITSYDGTIITGSGDGFTCKVYGNIMSLVDEENFATATTLSANYTFRSLFSNFTTLTDASGLLLPATQLALATSCYYSMFQGCSALTAAPALPATQLVGSCYYRMFMGCSALTAAPELPATQLAAYCYYGMFQGCTALTTAPALPAETLASSCYRQMFSNCIALTASPVLPATQLVTRCYQEMFYNCSKLATVTCLATSGIGQSNSTNNWLVSAGWEAEDTKTFYAVSTANWPSGNNGIPTGWEHENVDN